MRIERNLQTYNLNRPDTMTRYEYIERCQSPYDWVAQISAIRYRLENISPTDNIQFTFSDEIDLQYLQPIHIVTLACLLASYISPSRKVTLSAAKNVENFLREDLHLEQYFSDAPHIGASQLSIFNLWKVDNEQTFGYSHSLSAYLKRSYFKGKDLSAFTNALNELYANVADHADANGIAYSYIHFDEKIGKIKIAFCDFGIGIPTCLKRAGITPAEGCGYVQWATKPGVSAKSSQHNAGKGLDDVISSLPGKYDRLKILSEEELFIVGEKVASDGTCSRIEKTLYQPLCFKGTLIHFEYDISELENEEIIGESDLLNDFDW